MTRNFSFRLILNKVLSLITYINLNTSHVQTPELRQVLIDGVPAYRDATNAERAQRHSTTSFVKQHLLFE